MQPGYLRELLPDSAPADGETFDAIRADVHSKIMPGLTHWSSPRFLAFFSCSNSYEANIAEMYSNAFNGAHFNWICSPAVTELETIVMDWLAKAISLPECYLSTGSTRGGGVLHGSASEAILTCMVAARDKFTNDMLGDMPEGEEREEELWRIRSRMVALGSGGTHSSTKKAAQVIGVRFDTVQIDVETGYGMTGPGLQAKVEALKAKGLYPFYVTATLGTTDVCAVDDFEGIAGVLEKHTDLWVHVDAAYAGSALLLDENKHYTHHLDKYHSFNFNPHKWMLTTFDCSAVWIKNRLWFQQALGIDLHVLKNHYSDDGNVIDYRDWQIPLGRRFRSLKLWFVMRSRGVKGLQAHIRSGVELAESLQAKLESRPDLFTIFTKARFGLVTFRLKAADEATINDITQKLYLKVNADGEFYWTSTKVNGKFAIRVSTSTPNTQEKHMQQLFELLVRDATPLVKQTQTNGHH